MADMNHARASFELVNFHGQLYAMGGFHGTQTEQAGADYVERYDPPQILGQIYQSYQLLCSAGEAQFSMTKLYL